MLRIKSQNSPRISNGLAVFAALMLMVSTVAGISDSALTPNDLLNRLVTTDSAPTPTYADEAPGGNTHKRNKSFKVSLLLFRID